ncbi:tautomerase family protein [Brevibacterium zhoupengii]|uniref:tautomerase family protein n=1 Tax=Brevibacterium zhoupengii TaxID=2898795 RepID=UPI00374D4D16
MPLVDITLYKGRSDEQKRRLASAISEAFVTHCDARPDSVHIIFRDILPEQWFKSAEIIKEKK